MKSLGRKYEGSLNDRHGGIEIQQMAEEGLISLNKMKLSGNFKVWILQFALYPRLMWPLTIYEVMLSRVEKIELFMNSYIRKWLGLPRITTTSALYKNGSVLELPLASIVELYKCGKMCTIMMLRQSKDHFISSDPPDINTGRNWNAIETTNENIAVMQFKDIMGAIQTMKRGLRGSSFKSWHTMTPKE